MTLLEPADYYADRDVEHSAQGDIHRSGADEVHHVTEGGVPKWRKLGHPIEGG